jgi:hypothetical protein
LLLAPRATSPSKARLAAHPLAGNPATGTTGREQGGPAIGTVKSAGNGSVLIEHALPDARIRRHFEPSAFVCTVEMPLAPPEERQ